MAEEAVRRTREEGGGRGGRAVEEDAAEEEKEEEGGESGEDEEGASAAGGRWSGKGRWHGRPQACYSASRESFLFRMGLLITGLNVHASFTRCLTLVGNPYAVCIKCFIIRVSMSNDSSVRNQRLSGTKSPIPNAPLPNPSSCIPPNSPVMPTAPPPPPLPLPLPSPPTPRNGKLTTRR